MRISFIFCERSWKTVLTTSVTEQRRSKRTSRPHSKLQSLWVAHQIHLTQKATPSPCNRASHFERSGFWLFFFIVFVCLLVAKQEDIEGPSRRSGKLRSKTEGALAANLFYRFYSVKIIKDPSGDFDVMHHVASPGNRFLPCPTTESMSPKTEPVQRAELDRHLQSQSAWSMGRANDCRANAFATANGLRWTALSCAQLILLERRDLVWAVECFCGSRWSSESDWQRLVHFAFRFTADFMEQFPQALALQALTKTPWVQAMARQFSHSMSTSISA